MINITIRVAASILAVVIAAPSGFAAAREDPGHPSTGGKSADQVAKQLSNPAGSLASLSNNLVFQTYKGDLPDADDQDAWSYQFQPVLPFPVGNQGRNIILRPLIPVLFSQPAFDVGDGSFDDLDTNVGDTTFDLVYAGNTMKNAHEGYLWGFGMAGTVPTATNNALGGDQWRGGPELFGGISRKWGLVGAVVNHQWNLGGGDGGPGSNDQSFSTTAAQYFYAIGLGRGWQLASGPVVVYDWKADSDDALTFPLGLGVAKTAHIGSMTWKFELQAQYFAEQPGTFGGDWQYKLTVTPVIHNPFVR